MKVTVMSIIDGVPGRVPKNLKNKLDEMEIRERTKTIHGTLRTS